MSKPGAGIEFVDLGNKTISSLGEENNTSPFGGIESDAKQDRSLLLMQMEQGIQI
jgi:hypothetical protein